MLLTRGSGLLWCAASPQGQISLTVTRQDARQDGLLSFSEVLLEMGVTVEKVKCAPPMALYPLQGNVVVLVYVRGSSLRRSANCLPEYCVCTADRP